MVLSYVLSGKAGQIPSVRMPNDIIGGQLAHHVILGR
jgi:hypothetical protein